jgi:transcriptional regulator with XRE-family HTH domain
MMTGRHRYAPSVALASDDVAADRDVTMPVDGDTAAFTRAVGRAVRDARRSMGWRLADLAEVVALSPSQLCRLEMGVRPISMGRLVLLCRGLGIEPRHVIAWAQNEAFPFGHDAWTDTGRTWNSFEVTTTPVQSRIGPRECRPRP